MFEIITTVKETYTLLATLQETLSATAKPDLFSPAWFTKWEPLATYFAALGTFLASGTALWIASKEGRPKLLPRISVVSFWRDMGQSRSSFHEKKFPIIKEFLVISVTNTGLRPVTINMNPTLRFLPKGNDKGVILTSLDPRTDPHLSRSGGLSRVNGVLGIGESTSFCLYRDDLLTVANDIRSLKKRFHLMWLWRIEVRSFDNVPFRVRLPKFLQRELRDLMKELSKHER